MTDRPNNGRGCFGHSRPLSLAGLDAAISETIGKPVRRDRLARDDRVYRWVCRRAIAEGSLAFKTTYAEAAAGASYDVPRLNSRANRREARHRRVSTVYRALSSLAAAGILQFEGAKKENGQWRCLSIRLLSAGLDVTPAGRSRRRPTRRPGGRVSFSRRSGTSPAVVLPDKHPRDVCLARARARAPGTAAGGGRGSIAEVVQASLRAADAARSRTPWPHERFDIDDQELVEVVEAFEGAFGRSALFSYRRHGPELRRILARLDRYAGCGWQRGAGRALACQFVQGIAESEQQGLGSGQRIESLAYLLPVLDEISKRRRRWWKRHWGPRWADIGGTDEAHRLDGARPA